MCQAKNSHHHPWNSNRHPQKEENNKCVPSDNHKAHPEIPAYILVENVFPFLDRITWNNLVPISKRDTHQAVHCMTSPWPLETFLLKTVVTGLAVSPCGNKIACGTDSGAAISISLTVETRTDKIHMLPTWEFHDHCIPLEENCCYLLVKIIFSMDGMEGIAPESTF